jgi:hypothetical protein
MGSFCSIFKIGNDTKQDIISEKQISIDINNDNLKKNLLDENIDIISKHSESDNSINSFNSDDEVLSQASTVVTFKSR